MWTRDGDFDNRPGAIFQPNHFVPVFPKREQKRLRDSSGSVSPKKTTASSGHKSEGAFERKKKKSEHEGRPKLPSILNFFRKIRYVYIYSSIN